MNFRLILPSETYPLRLRVLRAGQPESSVHWPMDHAEGTFHAGAELPGGLVSVATFQQEPHPLLPAGKPYRLRGMATAPERQGQGIGGALLRFGAGHARAQGADLIWCHARAAAADFYAREGFSITGEAFTIEGIGLHHLMHLYL